MTILEQVIWAEKYRPKTVAECIMPPRLKIFFQSIVDTGELPHMLIHGSPGTGKTSVARAMCEQLGLIFYFTNGSKDRGIATVREQLAPFAGTLALNGKRKVIIVDEADGATAEYQDALKSLIETYSKNCSFIFIANRPAKMIEAIHSRAASVEVRVLPEEKDQIVLELFRRMRDILKLEGVKYDAGALGSIIAKFFPDNRRIITGLQALAKGGDIVPDRIGRLLDPANYSDLYKALKGKNLKGVREWIVQHVDFSNVDQFIRDLYDNLKVYMKPESIPAAVMIFAQYQYWAAFVADQEINAVAMLTDLMAQCEFL